MSDSTERLIAELRDERDLAIAEVSRLRDILDNARFIPVDTINAMPEAGGWWQFADANGADEEVARRGTFT